MTDNIDRLSKRIGTPAEPGADAFRHAVRVDPTERAAAEGYLAGCGLRPETDYRRESGLLTDEYRFRRREEAALFRLWCPPVTRAVIAAKIDAALAKGANGDRRTEGFRIALAKRKPGDDDK